MNNNLLDITDVLKQLKYPYASIDQIKHSGDILVQNAKNWLLKHQKYDPYDSRVLAFRSLKHLQDKSVELLGIVSKCRIVFSPSYEQASVFVLLRYVCGFDYNNHLEYLTDHLWVDVNIASLESLHNLQIGIGDYLWIRGHVQAYQGHLKHLRGYKISLDSDVRILQCGYPLFINNHFSGQIIPYPHKHYLYKTYGFERRIFLGDEVSKKDRQRVSHGKFIVGYSALGYFGRIIHQGFRLNTRSNNPKLVAKTRSLSAPNLINHIEWVRKRGSHDKLLTSAKKLKQHPHIVESKLDKHLKKHLNRSLQYELTWCRLRYLN